METDRSETDPLTNEEEAKLRASVEAIAAMERETGQDEWALHWGNGVIRRLFATLDRLRPEREEAGLREATEDVLRTLDRVVNDSESQHPGGWGPDVTTVADLRDCQSVLRAALAVPPRPTAEGLDE